MSPDPVLGAFDAASWPLESIVVPPGARLVVITDGVVEASSAERALR